MAEHAPPKIRCQECGHVVRRQEKKCPLCGSPIPQDPEAPAPRRWTLILAGIGAFVFVLAITIFALEWQPNTATRSAKVEPPRQSRSGTAEIGRPRPISPDKAPQEPAPQASPSPATTTPGPVPEPPPQIAVTPDVQPQPAPPEVRREAPAASTEAQQGADMLGLGKSHLREGAYDLAMRDFSEAARLNPDSAEPFANRAFLYLNKADYDRAIVDFDEAIRLAPSSDLFANRALAHFSKRDYDRAIEDYGQAIRLSGSDAELFNDRGAAYAAKREFDRAIQDYDQALRLNPNFPAALNNRGWAYSQKGNRDRAIADYLGALKLRPEDSLRKHVEAALKALGVNPR